MNIEAITRPEELMELAITDPKQIIESCFFITNKRRERQPFILNDLQNEFYYQRTPRDDILKAGQLGFSTLILAILTVKFLLVPHAWAVSLSYESEATQRLFSKVDFWLDPRNMHPILHPFLSLSTDKIGSKVNSVMDSHFYIGTAGAHAFGRGDTIHYAHFSEVSRWKDAGAVATGILRAVPLPGTGVDTWIVGETTANGVGNYHHTEFKRAIDGKSEFHAYFALWLKHKEYELPGDPITDYTDDEKNLQELYPNLVTDAKLRWRRKMIGTLKSEDGRSPEDMFKQEFPSTWQEAFLFSGSPVFPTKKLDAMMAGTIQPKRIGSLIGIQPTMKFVDNEKGPIKVFEEPIHGEEYLIFGDVAENHDRCVGTVIKKSTGQVVAKFREVINARTFGKEIQKLGYWYNTAMLAIEINNMGQSTMDQVLENNYPNIYFRQRMDKATKTITDVPGWRTTEQSKAQMIGHMQNLMQEDAIGIPDADIVGEMMTFIRTKTGTMEAVEGAFDDCVISACGAYYILKLHPYVPPVATQHRETPGERLRRMRSAAQRRGHGRH